jgi:hypothetical protein
MADPHAQQLKDHRKLSQILDAIGTEAGIISLLVGGTLATHLLWLQRRTPSAAPH